MRRSNYPLVHRELRNCARLSRHSIAYRTVIVPLLFFSFYFPLDFLKQNTRSNFKGTAEDNDTNRMQIFMRGGSNVFARFLRIKSERVRE